MVIRGPWRSEEDILVENIEQFPLEDRIMQRATIAAYHPEQLETLRTEYETILAQDKESPQGLFGMAAYIILSGKRGGLGILDKAVAAGDDSIAMGALDLLTDAADRGVHRGISSRVEQWYDLGVPFAVARGGEEYAMYIGSRFLSHTEEELRERIKQACERARFRRT